MSHRHIGFSRLGYALLALLALGWGFNWPVMKIVLQDVPPLTFRGVCLLAGGIGVLLLAHLAGQRITLPRVQWSRLTMLAACNIVGWNVFAIYGVGLLPSGRAALLGYTMPLWSMTLSIWLLNDKLDSRRIAGLALGMAGILVLMGDDLQVMSGALIGVVCMLGAAFCWGLGVVLLKRYALKLPTIALTGWMMIVGGVPITLAAIVLEHDAWRPISLYPALGVAYNIVVAFMFCYWAWNRIVLMVPVAVASLSSLITPVIGVLSGIWLLGEQPSWQEFAAGALILAAIALVLRAPRAPAPVGA